MKKLLIILATIGLAAVSASAQCEKCIPPLGACFDTCFKRLMDKASVEEMVLVMGLEKKVATEIVKLRDSSSESFSYRFVASRLDRPTMTTIKESVRDLNETQIEYFIKPVEERRAINDALSELQLDALSE